MLPVGPTGYGNSPYSAESAFAGNPMLISLDRLVDDGLLSRDRPRTAPGRAAAGGVRRLPRTAAATRTSTPSAARPAAGSRTSRSTAALKRAHGEQQWTRWPAGLRDRDPRALDEARATFAEEIAYVRFLEWRFSRDFHALRAYAHERGVALIGDIPIFVAHDSADVWQHRELFTLDEATGEPTLVAGVPPDYFSETGQRWGNPLYRWDRMRAGGLRLVDRALPRHARRFDAIRLDHFIGFVRYWEIPATSRPRSTATGARARAPRSSTRSPPRSGALPLIAEDLGAVTPEVKALRDRFGLPGIKVLQFAFGTDPSAPDFLPHNYPRRAVVYTGTHDNDTTVGWFNDPGERQPQPRPDRQGAAGRAALPRGRRRARDPLADDPADR